MQRTPVMKATKANCDKRCHENLTQTCVASQLEMAMRFLHEGLCVAVYVLIRMKPHNVFGLMHMSTYSEKTYIWFMRFMCLGMFGPKTLFADFFIYL